MDDAELKKLFPNLTPGSSAPPMFRINGCGVALYGSRDHHEPTNTYVSTLCICLIFIPIIPIKAYRISDAESGGWYFLGTEPLSGFAKIWNALLASFIISAIAAAAWDDYTSSPDYRANYNLKKGAEYQEAGELYKAAEHYKLVANGRSKEKKKEGWKILREVVKTGMASDDPKEAVQFFKILVSAEKYNYANKNRKKELWQRGKELLSGKVGNNLEAANSLLKIMTPMAPSPEELQQQKFSLLKRMVSLNPDNIESTAELAVIYDKKGKKDKCLSLLEPLSNKLGTTEGARILGSIYLDKGKNEEALKIIEPYVTAKSKEIFKTNKEYNKQFVNAFNFSKSLLKSGRAYGFEYRKYKTLDNAGKKKLVNKYIFNYIKNSSSLKKAKAAYDKACVAVPISLKEAGIRCSNGEFKRADTILKNIASAAKTTPHYQVLRKRTDTGLGIKTLEKEK